MADSNSNVCPHIIMCPFFLNTKDSDSSETENYKEKYCFGSYVSCHRFDIREKFGSEMVPDSMFPDQNDMKIFENFHGFARAYEDFYSELCGAVDREMDRWAGKCSRNNVEHELVGHIRLLPHLFQLALCLMTNERISADGKGSLYVGLMYVVTPVDLISDHVSIYGWIDDLVVMAIALKKYLRQDSAEIQGAIRQHWQHSEDLSETLDKIITAFNQAADRFPPSIVRIIQDMFCMTC